MQRPPAIARYEQLYLAAFALSLVVTALSWKHSAAALATNPMLAEIAWLLPALTVSGSTVRLLLWYFTARRPSVVAKWIVVVFAGFSALGILTGLYAIATGAAGAAVAVVSIVSSVLYVGAAVYLFLPDALAWFGEAREPVA